MTKVYGQGDDMVCIEDGDKATGIACDNCYVRIFFSDEAIVQVFCNSVGIWHVVIERQGSTTNKLTRSNGYDDVYETAAEVVEYQVIHLPWRC